MSLSVSLISEEMRAQISRNYVASERQARFASFYFLTFITVALVAAGALVVDYMIVSEFWTRALANEFLELPGALGSSVAFKSMQVLFATVAAHILYEQLSAFGKAVFVRIVFVLALTMLLGVGVLLALMSLPNGIAATSDGSVGSSLGNALAGLGISTEATQETQRAASEIDQMRGWQPLAWLASLGIVFLVVTGVAALCVHYAVDSLRRVFHARDSVTAARRWSASRRSKPNMTATAMPCRKWKGRRTAAICSGRGLCANAAPMSRGLRKRGARAKRSPSHRAAFSAAARTLCSMARRRPSATS